MGVRFCLGNGRDGPIPHFVQVQFAQRPHLGQSRVPTPYPIRPQYLGEAWSTLQANRRKKEPAYQRRGRCLEGKLILVPLCRIHWVVVQWIQKSRSSSKSAFVFGMAEFSGEGAGDLEFYEPVEC
jgi:hypothetical protein